MPPNKPKSLKVNFIMNAILTTSQFIFPLITFPYVSRILQASGLGKISFATSLVSYFVIIAQLGIPTYGIRACAKARESREELSRTVHEILLISVVMTIAAYVLFFLLLVSVPKLQEERTLYIVMSTNILFNTLGMEWLYKSLEQYTYITIRSIAFKLISIIAMFLLVHQQSDYVIYGGISIFAASASGLLNYVNAHKYIDFRYLGGYNFKRHWKAIMVFFAMSCATTIYTNLDNIMLGFIKTDIDVGYYSAATKIKMVLVSIVASLGTVLLPRASYYIEHDFMKDFYSISQKAIHYVFVVASPLMIYFMLFAKYGIRFLSGMGYEGAILPMIIIMPTLLLIGLTNIMGIQILVPLGKEKLVLYSVIAGAITNLIVNSILIPPLSSSGAACGSLLAELVVFIVQYKILGNIAHTIYSEVSYWKIIISAFISAIVSAWVMKLNLSNFGVLMLSAIIYFGIYVICMNILKDELVINIERQILGAFIKKVKKKC